MGFGIIPPEERGSRAFVHRRSAAGQGPFPTWCVTLDPWWAQQAQGAFAVRGGLWVSITVARWWQELWQGLMLRGYGQGTDSISAGHLPKMHLGSEGLRVMAFHVHVSLVKQAGGGWERGERETNAVEREDDYREKSKFK